MGAMVTAEPARVGAQLEDRLLERLGMPWGLGSTSAQVNPPDSTRSS